MKLLPDSIEFFEVDGMDLVGFDVVDDFRTFVADDDDEVALGLSTSVVSSSDIITIAFDSLSLGDGFFVCSGSSATPISELCSMTGLSDRFFCEVFFFTSD